MTYSGFVQLFRLQIISFFMIKAEEKSYWLAFPLHLSGIMQKYSIAVSASRTVQCDLIIDFNYFCKFMSTFLFHSTVFNNPREKAIQDRKVECVNYVKKTFKHYRKMSFKNLLLPFDNPLRRLGQENCSLTGF